MYKNSELSAMDAQIEDVVNTLKSGKRPTVSGSYGKEIIRTIEHVYEQNSK